MKIQPYIILSLFMALPVIGLTQSEIIITHNDDLINPAEGIVLSEISYPLVRIKLANEAIQQRYPTSEITLIRHGRAVYQARFHGSVVGERNSLNNILGKARSGDKIMLRLRGNNSTSSDRIITIPLK